MSVIGRHFKLSQLAGIFLTLDEKHKYVNYYTEISLNSKVEDKSEFLLIISVFIGKNPLFVQFTANFKCGTNN